MTPTDREAARRLRQKKVFTSGDVAAICNVSPRTVTKWADSGRLRCYRIPGGPDRRFPRDALIRFMTENGIPLGLLEPGAVAYRALLIAVEPLLASGVRDAGGADINWLTAPDAFTAGQTVAATPPDAVVIDLAGLGRSEGLRLATQVRAVLPDAIIILVAGEDENGAHDPAVRAVDRIFCRPFDPAALAQVIRSVAGERDDAA